MLAHSDQNGQVKAVASLKRYMSLVDGWREISDTIDFPFRLEGKTIRSRIDQIYIRENLLEFSYD